MVKPLQQFLLGASVCIGAAIVSTPAFAGSLTNATVTGTAPYLTYDADANNTFVVPNDPSNLTKILSGNAASPTGNVELFSNSEKLSNATFQTYTGASTLNGKIGGLDLSLSSLTYSDWVSPMNGKTLGQTWFESTLQANNLGNLVSASQSATLFNIFTRYGGLQRFSDPNVAYVNQDATGLIRIGLAGHLNATPMIVQSLTTFLADPNAKTPLDQQAKLLVGALLPTLSNMQIQASELIKYSYNNTSGYLYSFKGTNSGLVEKGDNASHRANYEVTIAGVPPAQDVPEPSLLLGLMGIGGVLMSKHSSQKMQKSASEA